MSTASSSSAAPVRVQVHANGCGQITLTRTNALNALNLEMIKIMLKTLRLWRCDPDVTCVLIDAQMDAKRRTKVFCAGGDVKFLHSPPYAAGPADFLRYEYTLDYCVHSFPKPVVSLLDGVVLGGGVGLTAGSTFKIVTDKTSWAMPETTIGLFPDVGTTHTLSRMDNHFGYFLGMRVVVCIV
jgi:enoyl-CoA hydratase/carnithine racemase